MFTLMAITNEQSRPATILISRSGKVIQSSMLKALTPITIGVLYIRILVKMKPAPGISGISDNYTGHGFCRAP